MIVGPRQSRRSIAASKNDWQAPPLDYVGNRADVVTRDIYVEDGEMKNGGLGQANCALDITGFGNYAMPQLFDHFSRHHPDKGFVLDQENGCLAQFESR